VNACGDPRDSCNTSQERDSFNSKVYINDVASHPNDAPLDPCGAPSICTSEHSSFKSKSAAQKRCEVATSSGDTSTCHKNVQLETCRGSLDLGDALSDPSVGLLAPSSAVSADIGRSVTTRDVLPVRNPNILRKNLLASSLESLEATSGNKVLKRPSHEIEIAKGRINRNEHPKNLSNFWFFLEVIFQFLGPSEVWQTLPLVCN
jgi:hypothetical protein